MNNPLRNFLKSHLSYNQKLLLQTFLNTMEDPKNLKQHLNRYRFNKGVLHKAIIDFIPPVFSVMITDTCNLRCPTCLFLLENPDRFFPNMISPDKFQQLLAKYNKERKAEIIFLDGGEPLLHPDFDLLVDLCRKHGLSPKTSTNGILVEKNISSLLKLDYVNVSLDGYDYESFKKYRGGRPEQFDSIIKGLRLLKKHKVCFSMSYLLSTENVSKTGKMFELATDIKPNFLYFHNINPHSREQYRPLTLQDEDTRKFLKMILEKSDYPFDIYIPAIFDLNSFSFQNEKCIQPWYYLLFNSVGDVSYCCQLPNERKIGNVFDGYNFNSPEMVRFRGDIIKGTLPHKNCLYCQRRFMGKEFGIFDSRLKKWLINNDYRNYKLSG